MQSVANANGVAKRYCHGYGYRYGDTRRQPGNCHSHGNRYGFGYANRYG